MCKTSQRDLLLFSKLLLFFLVLNNSQILFSQEMPAQLNKLNENNTLINYNDTNCINISGEWIGEEIQYDPTKSFIKAKFKVIFQLQQNGNRITGTSFIKEKIRGSTGDMKIRGVIINNILYFEEYIIINENMIEQNMSWCLRSGSFQIKSHKNTLQLISQDYEGYTSYNYSICTDHAEMQLGKNSKDIVFSNKNKQISETGNIKHIELIAFPNPFSENTIIKFDIKEQIPLKIDVFTLAGQHVYDVKLNSNLPQQEITIQADNMMPGVYLIRLLTNMNTYAIRIVKS